MQEILAMVLVRVDCDTTERDSYTSKNVRVFVTDKKGTAHKKAHNYINSRNPINLYMADCNSYPRYHLESIVVE